MLPLMPYIKMTNVIEINVVEENYICLELDNIGYVNHYDNKLSYDFWLILCQAIANVNNIDFDISIAPRISSMLPGGHRLEALFGSCVYNSISVSIRLKRNMNYTLHDFNLSDNEIKNITSLIRSGCNCIISGGTNVGKTSFLNTLLANTIDINTRVLSIEDTPEIHLSDTRYSSRYFVNRNNKNNVIGYPEILEHIMRSRPDIIVLGEISINNAFVALRLLNSGHKGFFCTIHANNPKMALDYAFQQNINIGGNNINNIGEYLRSLVDIVIQLESVNYNKVVREIYYPNN